MEVMGKMIQVPISNKDDHIEWLDDGEIIAINTKVKEISLACCDCGLVHRVEILRHFPWFLLGAFQLRFTRLEGETKNLRTKRSKGGCGEESN